MEGDGNRFPWYFGGFAVLVAVYAAALPDNSDKANLLNLSAGELGILELVTFSALAYALLVLRDAMGGRSRAPYALVESDAESGVGGAASPPPAQTPAETSKAFFGWATAFGACMALFTIFHNSEALGLGPLAADKAYDMDYFWFIMLLLLLASLLTLTEAKEPCGVLSRDQTEEWKGWMQIIFLAYHYYANVQVYNLVRVLIAAYVWMTGFGHFSYFYKAGAKYELVRIVRMLLRLNFMVIFTCLATNTPYILYYICAMHTFWFLFTTGVMYIGHQHNRSPGVVEIKFAATFVFITVLFETPGLFKALSWPLSPLLEYHGDGLHEWEFRVGLDRYAAFVGMICGYYLPSVQAYLERLEASPSRFYEYTSKAGVSAVLLLIVGVWGTTVFPLEKYTYNEHHPYFSMVPVVVYLWFRNLTPWLRRHHLGLFAAWGKVTLESYIAQFHILLTATTKKVLYLLPGLPYINSLLCTIMFGIVSHILFHGTVYFSTKIAIYNRSQMLANASLGAIVIVATLIAGELTHLMLLT